MSTERQQLLVMYLGQSWVRQVANSHKRIIGCLYRQKRKSNAPGPILKMCVKGVSTIVGLPLWLLTARFGHYGLYISFCWLLNANSLKNTEWYLCK